MIALLATVSTIMAPNDFKPLGNDSDIITPESPRPTSQTTITAAAPEIIDTDMSTQVKILMGLENNQSLVEQVLKAVGDRTYTPATATAQLKAINTAIAPMSWQLREAFLKRIANV